MNIADELRRDADAALSEDGMYYSGECLDGIAKKVEEVEAENAKLRELIRTVWLAGDFHAFLGADEIKGRMRELGIETE